VTRRRAGVVVVAFGDEPLLAQTLDSVLGSQGVTVDLVVVDNGFTCPDRGALERDPRIRWIRPGRNTGFTGGCNRGAAAVRGEVLVFVNSDAVVAPDAVAALADAVARPGVGLATGCVELYDEPGVANAAGNPVHYSLLSWAGGWGDPVADHAEPGEPASVSGALFAVRRDLWDRLGGFHEALFAYGEDVELSLRAAMAGYRIRYEPRAQARHHYEFHRNPAKMYLLERNRLVNLLTLLQWRTLVALAPGLLAVEAGTVITAARQGWLREKLSGYRWLFSSIEPVAARRRLVQSARITPDAPVLRRMEVSLQPSPRSGAAVPPSVDRIISRLGRLGGGGRADHRPTR
jgi:GT2 family glycosyltransferase